VTYLGVDLIRGVMRKKKKKNYQKSMKQRILNFLLILMNIVHIFLCYFMWTRRVNLWKIIFHTLSAMTRNGHLNGCHLFCIHELFGEEKGMKIFMRSKKLE
jgi:glycopeptide antibiotics resistance protein